jgi:hypothetical protein
MARPGSVVLCGVLGVAAEDRRLDVQFLRRTAT